MTSDELKSATKDTAAAARGAGDRVRDLAEGQASGVADRMLDAASSASEVAGDVFDRARKGAADIADKMPGSAGDAFVRGRETYRSGSERVARQVGKQPIEALLLAGAIGYLVGWAANRS